MGSARYLPKIAILILGIAIGAAIAVLLRPAAPANSSSPPSPSLSGSSAEPRPAAPANSSAAQPPSLSGSSAELGARLLRLVGRNLIADDRARYGRDGPMHFFAVPLPYGNTLCRVDVYTVATKIVRGRALSGQEESDNDLKVETQYGLWKRPSAAGGDEDKACAAFRDFDHLIEDGGSGSVDRGTFVMDTLLDRAKAGTFGFKVSCRILYADPGAKQATCDPLAVLRALSLQDIYRVEMKSEVWKTASAVRRDEISVVASKAAVVAGCGKGNFSLTITVEDEQHFGKQSSAEADILSADIEFAEAC
jgi:hypothetical protein